MCVTKVCEIGDIQSDPEGLELHRVVDAFIEAEALEGSPYSMLQQRAIEESGLNNESVDTILALRGVLSKWKIFKQKLEQQ